MAFKKNSGTDVMHQAMNLAVPQHDVFFFGFYFREIGNHQGNIRSDFILNNFELKKSIVFFIIRNPFVFHQLIVFPAEQFRTGFAAFPFKEKIAVAHVYFICKPFFQSAGSTQVCKKNFRGGFYFKFQLVFLFFRYACSLHR